MCPHPSTQATPRTEGGQGEEGGGGGDQGQAFAEEGAAPFAAAALLLHGLPLLCDGWVGGMDGLGVNLVHAVDEDGQPASRHPRRVGGGCGWDGVGLHRSLF